MSAPDAPRADAVEGAAAPLHERLEALAAEHELEAVRIEREAADLPRRVKRDADCERESAATLREAAAALRPPEGEVGERDAGYATAIYDVLVAIRDVHAKASDPTPLHKGIRMACSSISDRVEALADISPGPTLKGYADTCSAMLDVQCEGFRRVDEVRSRHYLRLLDGKRATPPRAQDREAGE